KGNQKLSRGNTFVVAAVVVELPFLDRTVALPVLARLWGRAGPPKNRPPPTDAATRPPPLPRRSDRHPRRPGRRDTGHARDRDPLWPRHRRAGSSSTLPVAGSRWARAARAAALAP